MSLQNRVDPWGQPHAVPEHGTMMGNRGGKFHGPDQTLGKRRWASTHWICCDIHYKNMKHDAMGRGYTSLFFLDEVNALNAGHRPCFFCRRKDAKAFLGDQKVGAFDAQLHIERLASRGSTPTVIAGFIPAIHGSIDGTADKWIPATSARMTGYGVQAMMVELEGKAYAIRGNQMLHWTFGGYDAAIPTTKFDKVLTPASIIAILQSGHKPRWHESALQWD